MKKLLIWGAGDQGLVTLDYAIAMNMYNQIDFMEIKEKTKRDISGYSIYKETDFDKIIHLYDEVIIATGNNDLREVRILKLDSLNIPIATLIHPSAIISPTSHISKGTTVLASVVINTNAYIGTGCIINTGAIIEHDCIVGDFTNICPKVAMAGHAQISKKSFIGTSCTIIDDIRVGENVIIGAGSVVIRDIIDNVTAVGVPAKIIKRGCNE